jgi:hypothetical protein
VLQRILPTLGQEVREDRDSRDSPDVRLSRLPINVSAGQIVFRDARDSRDSFYPPVEALAKIGETPFGILSRRAFTLFSVVAGAGFEPATSGL